MPIPDPIFEAFLVKSHEGAMKLATSSDIVQLHPEAAAIPQRYVAEFHCRGLVRDPSGRVVEADRFLVGISFPEDYLKSKPNTLRVLTWLEPASIFHLSTQPTLNTTRPPAEQR